MNSDPAGHLKIVDSIDVCVLVDNVVDPLSSLPKDVTGQMAALMRKGLLVSSGHASCCANHGLSLVITARVGTDIRILLFDTGPEAYTLARNGDRLGIPFGEVGALVLSHGHFDHGGGLAEAIRLVVSRNGGNPVACHVNDEMFVTRAVRLSRDRYLPFEDILRPGELARLGARMVSSPRSRLVVDDLFYLSGEIPRATPYEKGLVSQVKWANGTWEPDPLVLDERYVAAHVRGRGIVVFSACSHAGVINVLNDARATFRDAPVYAIIGGFHLAGNDVEPAIPGTVEDMRQFALKRIVPAHCTGWRAVRALARAFGEEVVVPAAVGRIFRF
ncbi:MAG: MBL fold metallo-hydrolase [Burkholderiales bacterium]|nr:MBL fold metallo-hydrolase [Burkholderiales bacterium]